MKKQIVATGVVLFSFMLPLKATAATFSQLFVFGDSLSDTGNAFIATGGLVNPTQATPPSPPYFPGRFSNGPIWVDTLAQKLNVNLTPFLALSSPDPTASINFAVGGATTGEFNAFVPSPPFPPSGLQAQIKTFTSLKAAGLPADSNALYTVLAGGNDLISGSIDPSGSVNNVSKAVTSLYNAGARNILVGNLFDFGKTPRALGFDPLNPVVPGTAQLGTLFTNGFNNGLAQTLGGLNQSLPGINLISLDINSVINNAIEESKNSGSPFTNVTQACLFDPSCISSNPVEQNQYLWWDGIHPTAGGHRLIADAAFNAIEDNHKSVPEPSAGLGILALGALGAGSMLKRQHKKVSLVKVKVDSKC
ncbi:MAG: SGNH/GDSL hydrolase family protein [Coleofasciculus sp. C3-bin4]|nr:SGNH/GDSL hydrolase family protein [Coleofasciculus sp. C3-bin4]